MRLIPLVLLLLTLGSHAEAPAPAASADCRFALGFAALRQTIPEEVGDCLADVRYDDTGDALQATTAWHGQGGLLYWRKADNWTGFTDGYQTWTAGPNGIEQRLNVVRFPWEPDRVVPALRNAEFRLPVGFDPRNAAGAATFRLTEGLYENREQRVRAQLIEPVTASGDLDGDGVWDALALVVVNSGGSGIFEFAVAVTDRDGTPVQGGYEFLGDRVRVNRLRITDRQMTVDLITQGPNEPMCCPAQRVVRQLNIQVPHAAAPPPCGSGASCPALEAGPWKLESYRDASGNVVPVLPGSVVTAEFRSGRVSGKAGCNGYTGAYESQGNQLTLGKGIATTRMFCNSPTGVMDQEATFLGHLASATRYAFADGKLQVVRADGVTVLNFTKA